MKLTEFIDLMILELDEFEDLASADENIRDADMTPMQWYQQMILMLEAKDGKASN